MKLNKKLAAIRITGLVLLVLFTRAVISYTNFEFEIPFFLRTGNKSDIEDNVPKDGDLSPTVPTTEDIINLQNVINPNDLIDVTANPEPADSSEAATAASSDNFFVQPANDLRNQGYYVSDGIYEKNGGVYDYVFGKVEPEYQGISKEQHILTDSGPVNVIEPTMGFFTIRSADSVTLFTSMGQVASENFMNSGMKILGRRDINNNTVFAYNYNAGTPQEQEQEQENDGENGEYDKDDKDEEDGEDEKNGEDESAGEDNSYFIYDPSIKSFLQTGYSDIYGDRGIPFAYPSHYGANGVLSRYMHTNGKWGYLFSDTGNIAISALYDRAFNYSDGVGVAYTTEAKGNRLHFLDENGYALNYGYFAPDEATREHLGFFYFEKGLTRAYAREFDRQGRLIVERDVLVDKYGNEFYIPEDYTIKAYSNGAALLEKDDYYGFMSYDGSWIAQPIFTYAQPFYEGVAVIGFRDGKKALIDTRGNIILKFHYDYLSNAGGGVIAGYEKDKGWTVFVKMRKIISPESTAG